MGANWRIDDSPENANNYTGQHCQQPKRFRYVWFSTYFMAADSKSDNRFDSSGSVFYLQNIDVHYNNSFITYSVVGLYSLFWPIYVRNQAFSQPKTQIRT